MQTIAIVLIPPPAAADTSIAQLEGSVSRATATRGEGNPSRGDPRQSPRVSGPGWKRKDQVPRTESQAARDPVPKASQDVAHT